MDSGSSRCDVESRSFLEHIRFHDVKAAVFDPHTIYDMADKIAYLLDNPALMRETALHSRKAMCRYTWDMAAERYLQVFDELVVYSK